MNKHLRIWLFVLLSTLLTSTTLPAEGVITLTTSKAVGERITLCIRANGSVSISGVRELARTSVQYKDYTLTSQTIIIRGNVTKLWCNSSQLTSLDVSGCSALTELHCYGNQLTSLDVSQNTVLTKLDCSRNQLTSLDVSGCTALTELTCYNSQLTSLNLSGCTALTKLTCYNSQLTSLDVSGCSALTMLNCQLNQLTSLDVSGCTALTTLDCYNNQLTSLDVSGCTALTKLECSNNRLTSLDVSGCTNLSSLSCSLNSLKELNVAGCTNLSRLYCSSNLLRQLNVAGCTNLSKLSCYLNQIKEAEMADLVNSLPDRQGAIWGDFDVFSVSAGYEDGNICLATHVATAKAKNWRPLFFRYKSWYDYEGLDKFTFAVTSSATTGGMVAIIGAPDLTKVPYGTELTINATPAAGYELTALTANGTDILATKKVVVTGNMTVKATFTKKAFAVTLSKDGEGTITATGAEDLDAVAYGTELTINATPADGYELTALTANGQDILAAKKMTIKEAVEVKATFTKKSFAITFDKEGEGTITATGADDLKAVAYGTELTINATPAEGYELTALTANGTDILASKKVIIKEAVEVKATFTKKNFAVTFAKDGEGTISATGAEDLDAVAYGTELTINATPADGYELTALTANGQDILASKKVIVKEAVEVKATFTKKNFAVTFAKDGEGTITATGADDLNAVAYGTELTIVATPAEGYELTALTANGTDILATKKVIVKEAVEVKATFTKKNFAVTFAKDGEGTITATGADDLNAVAYGTELTIVATPAAGYKLTALTANGKDILATKKVVIKGATEVKATFVDHTGVETTVTQQVKLYPNPATDYVIVEGVAPASEVTLHSMTGERLYAGRADGRGTLQIDLTPYADGVYLVCVADKTYRVVVRH